MKRLIALLTLGLCLASAHAQGWPQRPVKIVAPYGAGSSPDVFARLLADRLGPRLGQHTLSVLQAAGLNPAEIEALIEAGGAIQGAG